MAFLVEYTEELPLYFFELSSWLIHEIARKHQTNLLQHNNNRALLWRGSWANTISKQFDSKEECVTQVLHVVVETGECKNILFYIPSA